MKAKEIAFVALPVTDMARARKFYEGLLGLEKSRDFMDGKWIEYDLGASTLALVPASEEWKPVGQGIGFALEMDSFDDAIAELKKADAKFFWDAFESPVCHMAIVLDPDGNRIGIHQRKESNK